MSEKLFLPLQIIMNAKAATGVGKTDGLFVEDFKIALLQVSIDTTPTLTVKIQISDSDVCPDFSAAASKTNHWSYTQLVDYDDGSTVNGSTGIAASGTNIFKNYEVNINGARWMNASITAYTAGQATVKAKLYNNS